MRVAIVHPWFLASGGAELTVDVLAEVFPEADFFTLFVDKNHIPPRVRGRNIISLGLDWLPAKYTIYRYLLPFYPLAFESFDLRGYDLVISSDSCVAKGVLTDQGTVHICYCYSPMRCLYDQYRDFCDGFYLIGRIAFAMTAHYVRIWDYIAAQRVTSLVADSHHIADRIRKYYRRDSKVIYPPVNIENAYIDDMVGDYYLSVGRLTEPKKVDLLIEACNQLGRRLIVVGSGREMSRLKKLAGKTIEFVGRVSDSERSRLYAQCRALLFPPYEDFGIVPVEAQAHGRPVIAYGLGGSRETVIDSVTGLYFQEQTVASIVDAILRFESVEETFIPERIQRHAKNFDTEVFKVAMRKLAQDLIVDKSIR